jgi:hypothetical protein
VAFFFKQRQMRKHKQQAHTIPALTALCTLLFFLCNCLQAQDGSGLVVDMGKTSFVKGDTISFEASLPNYKTVAKTATLQVWAENIQTGRKWKFRYPLINGYLSAKLTIDSSLGNGVYALNFLLQKSFFSLRGHVSNAGKKDKLLNYAIISKNRQGIMDIAALDDTKDFSIRNLLFQDSAFIIFSRPGKKNNDLEIQIETPLDSAFTPLASFTKFIVIGDTSRLSPADTSVYRFAATDTKYKIIMPEVVVRSKSNKRLQDFDSENSTGSFSGTDALILDGLSSDEIADAPDLYLYLTKKVGGLRVETDNETGNRSFIWRGQPTQIYINEIRLDAETPLWINPADVAMIKVFRPGTVLMADASAGGAIAIYTKTGAYRQAGNRNYSFYILGYTAQEAVWK